MSNSNLDKMEESFLDNHSSNKPLSNAVIEQMGGFESFSENASDISNHGIDGGFSGFVNYSDTTSFAQNNREVILEALKEDAQDFGNESVPEMMSHWRSLDGFSQDEISEALYSNDENLEAHTSVYNAMAWYAGEKVSNEYVNAMEDIQLETAPEKAFDSIGEALDSVHGEKLGDETKSALKDIEEYLNAKGIEVAGVDVEDTHVKGKEEIEITITTTNYQLDSEGSFKDDVVIHAYSESNVISVELPDGDAKDFHADELKQDLGDFKNTINENMMDKIEISSHFLETGQVVTSSYHDNDHSDALSALNKTGDQMERLVSINGEPVAQVFHDANNPRETHFVVVNEESDFGKKVADHWNNEPNAIVSDVHEQKDGEFKSAILGNDKGKEVQQKDNGLEMD